MQLERRWLLGAGIGLSGLTIAASRAAAARTRSPAPAAELGVAPDTGRDVTATLQAAIDQTATRKAPLHLAPGRYIVRGLALRPGSRLIGAGPATVLTQASTAAVLTAHSVADAGVESLSIVGGFELTGPHSGLIEARQAKGLNLRDLKLETSTASAIALERCGGLVTGCRIAGAAKAGIFSIDAEGGLEISHNHLSAIANNGILVWRSAIGEDGTIVAMNRIERIATRDGGTGENGNGINVFRAGGVLVANNRISDCAYTAVRANSASNVQIVSNSVTRMGEVAIFVEFAFEGAVVASNLIDRASTGISVTNFDHGGRLATVQGNVVRNLFRRPVEIDPGGYGIAIEADAAVTGNTIEGAPAAGLQIGWGRFCRDVAATGNVIRRCGVGIAITSDAAAGAVLVASNMISGSQSGAIRLTDHGRLLGDDLALKSPSTGRLRISGNAAA
jgi:uncharacterized secreted repeat protein (TIGR03808 family)